MTGDSTQAPQALRMVARGLVLAGVALGLGSFAAALLPIEHGIWPRLEPAVLANLAAGAVVAAGLALGALTRARWVEHAIGSPVVLAFLALAAFGALAAPFAALPWLSIAGPPQNGEGALGWAGMALFAAGALALSPRPWRWALLAAAFIAAAVVLAAAALGHPAWAGTDKFHAWFALGLAALVYRFAPLPGLRLAFAGRAVTLTPPVLAALAALPILVWSQNRAALALAALVGVPGFVALRWWLNRGGSIRATRRLLAAAVLAAPLAAFAAIEIVGALGWVESIRARMRLQHVLLDAFGESPVRILLGHGWGHSGGLFLKHIFAAGAPVWGQSWDSPFRDVFHSHDATVEALVSGGLPSLAIQALLPALVVLRAPRRRLAFAAPFALIWALLAATWFQLPYSVAATALALGALATPWRGRLRRPALHPAVAGLSCALAAAQIVLFAVLLDLGAGMRMALAGQAPASRSADERPAVALCRSLPNEAWRGHVALRYALVASLERAAARRGQRANWPAAQLDSLEGLACAAGRVAPSDASAHLVVAHLLVRAGLSRNLWLQQRRPAFGNALADWESWLDTALRVLPERTDLAIPYFAWHLQRRNSEAVAAYAARMLASRPHDPVALWFSGLQMLSVSDSARHRVGILRLNEALDHGIELRMPVDPGVISQLRSGRGSP